MVQATKDRLIHLITTDSINNTVFQRYCNTAKILSSHPIETEDEKKVRKARRGIAELLSIKN